MKSEPRNSLQESLATRTGPNIQSWEFEVAAQLHPRACEPDIAALPL